MADQHVRHYRLLWLVGHCVQPLSVSSGLDSPRLRPCRAGYRPPLFPFGPIFASVLCLLVIAGENHQAFMDIPDHWSQIVATYVAVQVFLGLWLSYRIVRKTRFIDYDDMPFAFSKLAIVKSMEDVEVCVRT